MTQDELDAIRARAEAATPGPWEAAEWADYFEPAVYTGWQVDPIWTLSGSQDNNESVLERKEDAEFIAHAREDVPALLAEVERLRDILLARRICPECNDGFMPGAIYCKCRKHGG